MTHIGSDQQARFFAQRDTVLSFLFPFCFFVFVFFVFGSAETKAETAIEIPEKRWVSFYKA